MSLVAALLFGLSVTLVTLAVWPRSKPRRDFEFVEDSRVPRTLH